MNKIKSVPNESDGNVSTHKNQLGSYNINTFEAETNEKILKQNSKESNRGSFKNFIVQLIDDHNLTLNQSNEIIEKQNAFMQAKE